MLDFIVVPRAGLEPALLAEPDFESHHQTKHLRGLQDDHVCIKPLDCSRFALVLVIFADMKIVLALRATMR